MCEDGKAAPLPDIIREWLTAKQRSNSEVFCHLHFVNGSPAEKSCVPFHTAVLPVELSADCSLLRAPSRRVDISKYFISSKYTGLLVLWFKPYFCVLFPSMSHSEHQKVQKLRYIQGKHFHADNRLFL